VADNGMDISGMCEDTVVVVKLDYFLVFANIAQHSLWVGV